MRYLFIIFSLLLAAPVLAQSEFNVSPERENSGDSRTLAEIEQMKEAVSDLEALENEIVAEPEAEPAVIKPAYVSILQCDGDGYRINWDDSNAQWRCIRETDPNYKTYAKTDLPNCGSGQALTSTNGTSFTCVTIPIGEKGDKPAHQWSGTSVRFQTPSGSWGSYTDLRGPKGTNATCP